MMVGRGACIAWVVSKVPCSLEAFLPGVTPPPVLQTAEAPKINESTYQV